MASHSVSWVLFPQYFSSFFMCQQMEPNQSLCRVAKKKSTAFYISSRCAVMRRFHSFRWYQRFIPFAWNHLIAIVPIGYFAYRWKYLAAQSHSVGKSQWKAATQVERHLEREKHEIKTISISMIFSKNWKRKIVKNKRHDIVFGGKIREKGKFLLETFWQKFGLTWKNF